jgi:hypothetical protein
MESGVDPRTSASGPREFSDEDAKILREILNDRRE